MHQPIARDILGAPAAHWAGPIGALITSLAICNVGCALSLCGLAFYRPTVWFEFDRTFVHESLAEKSALGGLVALLFIGSALVFRVIGRPIVAGVALALCGATFLTVRVWAVGKMADIASPFGIFPTGDVLDDGGLPTIADIGAIGLLLTAIAFVMTLGMGARSGAGGRAPDR
jgi:hypothetical protein